LTAEDAIMQFEVKFGSVSWINKDPNPIWLAAKAEILVPEWVPKTYIGLVATANDEPPDQIQDIIVFQDKQQFRAFTHCHLGVVVDDSTKKVTKVVSIQSVTNPGFTPPFSVARYPSAGIGSIKDGWQALKATWSFASHPGEESPLSGAVTLGRHANTSIATIPASETVLANMLIKFRAGSPTDDLGVNVVKCPYHVPWVWCETVLTYQNEKTFKLYGRGSIFPTHSWYLDGKQVMSKAQVGDLQFPKRALVSGAMGYVPPQLAGVKNPFAINVPALALYPVLSAGASAGGPQTTLTGEKALPGSVDSHPNAAPAGAVQTYP
jgi:hypothetical protein